ncbi:MAG: ABC transporter permease subunit [Eubacteriales bacterium]|nr:ABC transporter permease subunit [Eubacteriales bacterium]
MSQDKKNKANAQVEAEANQAARSQEDLEAALKEEAIQSPGRVAWRRFTHNTLGMIGFCGFILIFVIIFIGSLFVPFEPYFTNGIMKNIAPGYGYMDIPGEMVNEGIRDISVGSTYSVGVSEEGNYYLWGFDSIGNLTMPDRVAEELKNKEIAQVAAGNRHILVMTEDGEVYGWGNNEFGQAEFPSDKKELVASEGLAKIAAGDDYSVGLTKKGNIFVWGSTLPNRLNRIPKDLEGQVADMRTGGINIMLLLKDGSMRLIGSKGSEIDTNMPAELKEPGNDIVDFARTQYSCVVLLGNGELITWGSKNEKVNQVPEMEGKIIDVDAGRQHFVALTDEGKVYGWGLSYYGVTEPPQAADASRVVSGYYNNYVISEDGHSYKSWGLNGFLFGTDDMGRDLFGRLIHGGKMTLIIAFFSIIISLILGIVIGLISGFYGGWVDNFLMRFSEIVASFPFYPLIITLSAILPPDISQYKRYGMIMGLLGILGWTGIARLIRGQIISEREKDYVTAAKALGLKDGKIMRAHIFPNVMSILIVNLTVGFAANLLTETGLSFLGFGVVEPLPSWGNMMTSAQSVDVIEVYWWRWIFPGLAVFLTALSVNLMGDALREALDPKAKER